MKYIEHLRGKLAVAAAALLFTPAVALSLAVTDVAKLPSTTVNGALSNVCLTNVGQIICRSFADTLMERPSVVMYGVDMSGVKDSTAAFTAALNSKKHVVAPCGIIRMVGRADVANSADFAGAGPCTLIKNDAPAGSAADRVINIMPSAVGTRLDNFALTQQVSTKNFVQTTACNKNIICGSAILVQADDSMITRAKVSDAFDNCIAFGQLDATNPANYVPFNPKRASFAHIRTFSCGSGPRKEGGGIDVATASSMAGNDLIDEGSSAAFILDIGAGANGTFSNLTGNNTRCGVADGGGGGRTQTFYLGSGDSTFSNLVSVTPCDRGIWIDGYSKNLMVTGLYIKAPGKECMLIKTGYINITNTYCDSPGYGSPSATYASVYFDSTNGPLPSVYLNGIGFGDLNGTQGSVGFYMIGNNTLEGAAVMTDTSGVASITAVPNTFKVIQPRNYPN